MILYIYQEVILLDKQLKGYVFRIYPNQNQKQLIDKSFGVNWFIYNNFLEKSKQEKIE